MVNKNADSVRDEIEASIYRAAVSILAGEGFSFSVPSRSKGNQLYALTSGLCWDLHEPWLPICTTHGLRKHLHTAARHNGHLKPACRYVPELDRIVLKDSMSQRPFASSSTCRKAVITARILGLIHELCLKGIHVTKRDLFYTDVKLFEVRAHLAVPTNYIYSSPQHAAGCCLATELCYAARLYSRGAVEQE